MTEAFMLIIGWTWMITVHLRYARANYPESWRWRANLFLAGALAMGAVGPAMEEETNLLVLLIGSILGGVLSAWAFPMRMRYIIPRRRER
ncbi:hypothetical protein GC175_00765 [bacterium]|nr:hypothetical protein [bacterium]